MIQILTWADAARVLPLLAPDLQCAVQAHLGRLGEFADYPLYDLAEFIIVEPGEIVSELTDSGGGDLLPAGADTFPIDPEYAAEQGTWIEVVWIISDDGKGVVLFVPATSREIPRLLTACQKALRDCAL